MTEYSRESILESLSFEGKQPGEIWDLSDFKIDEELPSGLAGKINIAIETISEKKCVIKEIEIGISSYNNEDAIQNEIKILKLLYGYSGIIKLYGYFVQKCNYYLIFEYGGVDLLEYMQENGKIEPEIYKKIFQQMVEIVHYCHQNGVMHRDIKPENFLYDKDTEMIKLIDFGFATTEKTSCKKMGTPRYFSPEVNGITSTNVIYYSYGVDIWSLGCIFYIFISGRPFYDITKLKTYQLPKILKTVKEKLIGYDPKEIDLLFKMLEIVPYKRASIEELREHEYFVGKKFEN